MFFLKIKKGKR